ncbi:hypothetical protein A9Q99_21020 [Gammaproteobacteria bacterium 45_16_T64]|nr:hypothetical protein A9Q99_21020 [Gammaproteobacteria bacterium 45_16_T64]
MGVKNKCERQSGNLAPKININRCEGKGPCVSACPYDVLEMGVLTTQDRRRLSLVGKVKAFVHGGKQARVVLPDACRGCNLCVTECPEDAIELVMT